MIEAGQRQLGQVGQIVVPRVGGGLQLRLGRAVLAQFFVGNAGKVVRFGALGKPAVLLCNRRKLRICGFGAFVGGGVNAVFSRCAGRRQRRAVGVHGNAQGDIGGSRAHVPKNQRADDQQNHHQKLTTQRRTPER